jgi:hypothetical protein
MNSLSEHNAGNSALCEMHARYAYDAKKIQNAALLCSVCGGTVTSFPVSQFMSGFARNCVPGENFGLCYEVDLVMIIFAMTRTWWIPT